MGHCFSSCGFWLSMHNSMAAQICSIKAETTFVPIARVSAHIPIELLLCAGDVSFILVIRSQKHCTPIN